MSDKDIGQGDPVLTAEEDTDKQDQAGNESVEQTSAPAVEASPQSQDVEFPSLNRNSQSMPAASGDINRLQEVKVKVSAELGKATMTIKEILAVSEGSVVELDRSVKAPIELFAQGVAFGNGEVVVIDDQFAVRIKQIYPQ